MNNCFVVLAAGNSRRFKSEIPKQFSKINGVMMLDYSVNTALKSTPEYMVRFEPYGTATSGSKVITCFAIFLII